MTCTAPDCGNPTSVLHLCDEHLVELKDLLDGVDFLIVNLDPAIQAGKVIKKPGGQEGGNGTRTASSRPPTTDTNQLRYWLWELPRNAYIEARDNPQAGRTLFMARIWVPKAREAVYGPEREEVDHDAIRAKVAEAAPPMPTRQLLPWLRKNAKISITSQHIRDWVRRGHLKPVEREPSPTYHPHEVIAAHHRKDTP